MLDHFDDQRTIFVTGKGGVGKSTVTAALGRAFADRGERVLVAETATYSAMSSLLGTDLPSEEPAAVDPPLYGVELEASTCFVEALHDFLPSRKVIRTLVDNRVARVFFDAAPGINEFAILNQIDRYLEQGAEENPDWDRVIVDLPASGHAVTFLGVPETYVDLMKVGPIADRAGTLADRIRDPTRTALVAVALPEQMPVNETVELEQGLRNQLDRELTVVALNMLHRSPLDPDQREQFEQMVQAIDHDELVTDPLARPDDRQTALDRFVAGNVLALGWHDRDEHHAGDLARRIESDVVDIPVIYASDGATIVDRMSEYLGKSKSSARRRQPAN